MFEACFHAVLKKNSFQQGLNFLFIKFGKPVLKALCSLSAEQSQLSLRKPNVAVTSVCLKQPFIGLLNLISTRVICGYFLFQHKLLNLNFPRPLFPQRCLSSIPEKANGFVSSWATLPKRGQDDPEKNIFSASFASESLQMVLDKIQCKCFHVAGDRENYNFFFFFGRPYMVTELQR